MYSSLVAIVAWLQSYSTDCGFKDLAWCSLTQAEAIWISPKCNGHTDKVRCRKPPLKCCSDQLVWELTERQKGDSWCRLNPICRWQAVGIVVSMAFRQKKWTFRLPSISLTVASGNQAATASCEIFDGKSLVRFRHFVPTLTCIHSKSTWPLHYKDTTNSFTRLP